MESDIVMSLIFFQQGKHSIDTKSIRKMQKLELSGGGGLENNFVVVI